MLQLAPIRYSGPDSMRSWVVRYWYSFSTTGLLIGGAAGALIGNQVAGRGDRLLGTVIGGAAGALIGREVDRGSSRNRGGRRCR